MRLLPRERGQRDPKPLRGRRFVTRDGNPYSAQQRRVISPGVFAPGMALAHPRTMPPAVKTTAAIAGLVAMAVAFFVALAVAFLDRGSLRGPIERAVAARTGRALAIGGEVEVDLGWRIAIVLNDVRLSNPAWARRAHFLEARRVPLAAPLPSLLIGRLSLEELTLEQPMLALRARGGARSWGC